MNNWLDALRFSYSNEVQFKSMEEFLNVKDVTFEEK
jgi:hypothetical protein